MSELDYAFLAEYASIDPSGRLNALGASYTHVAVPQLPGQHLLSVAGRIRAEAGAEPTPFELTIKAPGEAYVMHLEGEVSENERSRPYDGKVGLLFVFNSMIPLPMEGLYEVLINVDGRLARRLAFDVAVGAQQQS